MSEPPNRVLEFLTAPVRPNGDSCRANRRRASSVPIEFAWCLGHQWRSTKAKLLDISRGGACVLVADPPPMTVKARFRFLMEQGSPWVEVEILEVERHSRRHRVRVRFDGPCPNFVLRSAVLDGSEGPEAIPEVRPTWAAMSSEVAV